MEIKSTQIGKSMNFQIWNGDKGLSFSFETVGNNHHFLASVGQFDYSDSKTVIEEYNNNLSGKDDCDSLLKWVME